MNRIRGCFAVVACVALAACDMNTGALDDARREAEVAVSNVQDVWWVQDFSENTDGWYDRSNGGRGTIVHNLEEGTATLRDDKGGAPSSDFGGAIADGSMWPGDHIVELDILLESASFARFDYSVWVWLSDGSGALPGFFTVATLDDGTLGVREYTGELEWYVLADEGWYTFQHVIRDSDGELIVDLNLLDSSGLLLATWSLANASLGAPADAYAGAVTSRFTRLSTEHGLDVDNHKLYQVVPGPTSMDDCKTGGFEDFGFRNQGQCIASVMANENSGR